MKRFGAYCTVILLMLAVVLQGCAPGADEWSEKTRDPDRWPQEVLGRWVSVDDPEASWTFRGDGTGLQDGIWDFDWQWTGPGELTLDMAGGPRLVADYRISGDTLILGDKYGIESSVWKRD